MILRDIFEMPTRLSVKMIGISTIRNFFFQQKKFISIWNEYPSLLIVSRGSCSRVSRLKHLKPPVESFRGRLVTMCLYVFAP